MGQPMGGKPYQIGEDGKEMYVPDRGTPQMIGMGGPEIMNFPDDGYIIPNHDLPEQQQGMTHNLTELGNGVYGMPGRPGGMRGRPMRGRPGVPQRPWHRPMPWMRPGGMRGRPPGRMMEGNRGYPMIESRAAGGPVQRAKEFTAEMGDTSLLTAEQILSKQKELWAEIGSDVQASVDAGETDPWLTNMMSWARQHGLLRSASPDRPDSSGPSPETHAELRLRQTLLVRRAKDAAAEMGDTSLLTAEQILSKQQELWAEIGSDVQAVNRLLSEAGLGVDPWISNMMSWAGENQQRERPPPYGPMNFWRPGLGSSLDLTPHLPSRMILPSTATCRSTNSLAGIRKGTCPVLILDSSQN